MAGRGGGGRTDPFKEMQQQCFSNSGLRGRELVLLGCDLDVPGRDAP